MYATCNHRRIAFFWYTTVLLLRSAATTININVCTYSSCQVLLLMGTCNAPLLLDAFDKVLTGLGIFFGEEHVEFANVGLVAVGRNSWEAFIASMSSYSRITLGICSSSWAAEWSCFTRRRIGTRRVAAVIFMLDDDFLR